MALLAEEIVEEWLNRQGYFTIRGVKVGVHEIDLLAVRPTATGLECRQIEVQASVRPVSYITRVPKVVKKKRGGRREAQNYAKNRNSDKGSASGSRRSTITRRRNGYASNSHRAAHGPGNWLSIDSNTKSSER